MPSTDADRAADTLILDGAEVEILEDRAADPVEPSASAGPDTIDLRSATDRRDGRRFRIALLLIVLLAAGIRAIMLPASLPYTTYIDEGFALHPAEHMVAGPTWDPGWYRYPSLLPGATAVGLGAYSIIQPDVRRDAEAAEASPYYDVAVPEGVLIGRLLVWAASVATVAVTALLARRLAGRAAALVTALLVAVLPALVSRSAIVIVDTPTTFFVMATMLAASAVPRSRRPLVPVLVGGACVGLAATSKFTGAAAILMMLTAIAFAPGVRARARAGWAAATVAAAAIAAVVTMPALVFRSDLVRADIDAQAAIYAGKTSATSYAQAITSVDEVGWPLLLLGVAGIVVLLRSRAGRVATIGWLLFAAATAVFALRSSFQPFRNLLPFTPFLCLAAAVALVAACRQLRRRLGLAWFRPAVVAPLLGAALALVLVITGVAPQVSSSRRMVDSRQVTVDWLAANVTPGQRVLVAEEIAWLPTELERIPGEVVVEATVGADGFPTIAGFDYVVSAGFKDGVGAVPPTAGLEHVASFGRKKMEPSVRAWRTTEQLIDLWAPAGTAPAPAAPA